MALIANIPAEASVVYQTFISEMGENPCLIFPEGTDLDTVQFERINNTLKINYSDNKTFELTNVDFTGTANALINNLFVVGQEDETTPLKKISNDYHIYYTITDNFTKPAGDIYNYRFTTPTNDVILTNLSDKDLIVIPDGTLISAL